MKKHQVIYSKIKELLEKHFGSDIVEYDDNNDFHLTIGNSGIWISSDEQELTIGYGLIHQHLDPEYDDIENPIDRFFNLLTKKKRITNFYKGNFSFKTKSELIHSDTESEHLGTQFTWLFPFWKKTRQEVKFEEKMVDYSTIEKEVIEIKKLCTTIAKSNTV